MSAAAAPLACTKRVLHVTLQVCFCFTQSVASTRWMIQDELRVQNTQCDNCLIGNSPTGCSPIHSHFCDLDHCGPMLVASFHDCPIRAEAVITAVSKRFVHWGS